MTETAVYPLVCVVPDGAGVVNDKIRVFILREHIADALKNPGELFRIPGVHLTPESHYSRGQSMS